MLHLTLEEWSFKRLDSFIGLAVSHPGAPAAMRLATRPVGCATSAYNYQPWDLYARADGNSTSRQDHKADEGTNALRFDLQLPTTNDQRTLLVARVPTGLKASH
jgi:hypothetical protein